MPTFEFPDDEHEAVAKLIRKTLDETRYPYSEESQVLRRALHRLDPASAPKPLPERVPLPEAPMRHRGGRRARR